DAIPSDELPRAIGERRATRADRLALQVALEILAERRDRLVPLFGRLGQRLRQHVVQIAQPEACGFDGEEIPRRRSGRMTPGQENVEQDPQRVDVRRGRYGLAPHLLR